MEIALLKETIVTLLASLGGRCTVRHLGCCYIRKFNRSVDLQVIIKTKVAQLQNLANLISFDRITALPASQSF